MIGVLHPEIQAFYVLSASDVNELITQVYGQDFELVADQELSCHEYTFQFDGLLSPLDHADIKKWTRDGSDLYIFHRLMNDLVQKGVIPSGKYVIDCSW
jgi:hypothetical protein